MFDSPPLTFSNYQAQDLPQVLRLLTRPERLHQHLDWQPPEVWFTQPTIRAALAWYEDTLAAVMAVSTPFRGMAWLRVLALDGGVSIYPTARKLWARLKPQLAETGVQQVHALGFYPWMVRALQEIDFEPFDEVVTLRRVGLQTAQLPSVKRSDVIVREATAADIDAVVKVDNAAFDPQWWLSRGDLQCVMREPILFFLAALEGEPVGYALLHRYKTSVHLSRLATIPAMQGQGVGGLLLRQAIRQSQALGLPVMTVNTQDSNLVSRHLYRRFGFVEDGYTIPIVMTEV